MLTFLESFTLSETSVWLILFVVLILIELLTMGLTTIWFAGGALAGWLVALLGGPIFLQVVVFLVISIALLIFTRPIATKYFNSNRTKTNADSLIGATALVTKSINNIKGEGTVIVNGLEWTARTRDDVVIEKDKRVEILEIQGVKLIVKKKED